MIHVIAVVHPILLHRQFDGVQRVGGDIALLLVLRLSDKAFDVLAGFSDSVVKITFTIRCALPERLGSVVVAIRNRGFHHAVFEVDGFTPVNLDHLREVLELAGPVGASDCVTQCGGEIF